jgi:hypothetical protein
MFGYNEQRSSLMDEVDKEGEGVKGKICKNQKNKRIKEMSYSGAA